MIEQPDLGRKVEQKFSDGFTQRYLHIFAGPDGAGGAPHQYFIRKHDAHGIIPDLMLRLNLQEGSPEDVGVNGVGCETLLYICLDFLTRCQSGPFASEETGQVVLKLQEAFDWIKKREDDRKARGVYQTHQK